MPKQQLTGEQIKSNLLELLAPMLAFCDKQGITSFDLPTNGDESDSSFCMFTRPLPPRIKCVLERYGCIYVADPLKEAGNETL